MQDDVAEKLTALASCQEPLSESEVSHFLTLCRKYLDHIPREEFAKYPILKFFSNWALHITIDRSREGMEILKRLNDTLVEVASIPNNDLVISRLTAILSFPQLRREIGELLELIGVPDPIDKDQVRWKDFVRHLIEIIRDCPVEVGDVADMPRWAQEGYEAIQANPIKEGGWLVGVAVVEVDYGRFSKDGKNEICLEMLMSDTTHIMIPLAASEVFGPTG